MHAHDPKDGRDIRSEIIAFLDSYEPTGSRLEKRIFSTQRQGPQGRVRPKARPGSGGHTPAPR